MAGSVVSCIVCIERLGIGCGSNSRITSDGGLHFGLISFAIRI